MSETVAVTHAPSALAIVMALATAVHAGGPPTEALQAWARDVTAPARKSAFVSLRAARGMLPEDIEEHWGRNEGIPLVAPTAPPSATPTGVSRAELDALAAKMDQRFDALLQALTARAAPPPSPPPAPAAPAKKPRAKKVN